MYPRSKVLLKRYNDGVFFFTRGNSVLHHGYIFLNISDTSNSRIRPIEELRDLLIFLHSCKAKRGKVPKVIKVGRGEDREGEKIQTSFEVFFFTSGEGGRNMSKEGLVSNLFFRDPSLPPNSTYIHSAKCTKKSSSI